MKTLEALLATKALLESIIEIEMGKCVALGQVDPSVEDWLEKMEVSNRLRGPLLRHYRLNPTTKPMSQLFDDLRRGKLNRVKGLGKKTIAELCIAMRESGYPV